MTSRFAILTLVLASVACGSSPSGSNNQSPPPPPGGSVTTVMIGDNSFGSGNLSITAGTAVKWENGGLNAHTATSSSGAWDSGTLTASYMAGGYTYTGGSYQRTFSTPGTYPYHCTYHSAVGMQGTITVTP